MQTHNGITDGSEASGSAVAAIGSMLEEAGVIGVYNVQCIGPDGQIKWEDITAGSLVDAWLLPATTADHSSDEHLVDPIRVTVGNIVAGSGFTIYGYPADIQTFGQKTLAGSKPDQQADVYGAYNIAWVWN